MAVRLVVAVTDRDWFEQLRHRADLTEVNFWSPSAKTFHALQEGELFLFKLHAPINSIVGGGVFAFATNMPLNLAWEAFGEANGARSFADMRTRILRYRRLGPNLAAPIDIGCRVLTQPFFFDEPDWLPPPPSFSRQTVSFRGYSTDEPEGLALWDAVRSAVILTPSPGFSEAGPRYGEPILVRPRLGQGAFRLRVTDIYSRRCAITGERTLPALEAAHIKPFADGGEHRPSNGILMRRDIHSLFDSGYVTVTPDHHFEVSRRIREEFENGRDYYALHGTAVTLPSRSELCPDPNALRWHNESRYLG